MNKYVCIHGHFYQPPRENPWLEAIEIQDSAYPYHDWNERITAECYGPNTASRILDADGRIIGIMNNFSRISFNLGPTLLSWLEDADPGIYAAILEADKVSQELYNGHGSALAQVYNHMIMPLASSRDKRTQVLWGLEDFRRRFGRDPEGMWLAETAIDLETLELLADAGIKFTILAPRQARQVRETEQSKWHDVTEGNVDPRRPYICSLPSGRSIALFFYDGPIAQDLAFGGLLHNGERFAKRLLDAFNGEGEDDEGAQLVHIATDGETYGHHHKKGEMALSYCLHHIESRNLAKVTIYGEYLEKFPPTAEVRIHENSSWSCVHGVERWKSNCGCCSGMRAGWNQEWRQPLREALDWLRGELDSIYERRGQSFLKQPWKARDEYIQVILDRSENNVRDFLEEQSVHELNGDDIVSTLRLFEMQRHAMLMYTSCGWFFDEVSGIETTQIMRYAARAMQLATELGGAELESEFQAHLRSAPSNLPGLQNGEVVYQKYIKPSSVGLLRVGAHFAVSSLFQDLSQTDRIYSYEILKVNLERHEAGRSRLASGRIKIRSIITFEEAWISFAALYLGDQNATCGVREFIEDQAFDAMQQELKDHFVRGDLPETVRALDRHFEDHSYSMSHLFHDQQRDVLDALFAEAEDRIEATSRQMYSDHYYLMQATQTLNKPQLEVLVAAAKFVINRGLKDCLGHRPIDEDRYHQIQEQIKKWNIPIDREFLGLIGSNQVDEIVAQIKSDPMNARLLEELNALLAKYQMLDIPLNLWKSQNIIYEIGLQQLFLRKKMAEREQTAAVEWVAQFKEVSKAIGVQLD